MFGVTILGNNSAIPAFNRHPTAQVVTLQDQLFLIDCGEGTQMQMSRLKIRRSKIQHIFISHLHGDHYFGLIGLITSMGLLGREQLLTIYGPPALKDIIDLQLKVANTELSFPLAFVPLTKSEIIIDTPKFQVSCFTTQHRIPCWGFIIREKKKPRKIDKDKVLKHAIPAAYYEKLKDGEDYVTKTGQIIPNESLTIAASKARSYAYCADTIYQESLADHIQNVSLLYHETTYLHELADRAAARFHATTIQAGTIALKGNVAGLLIGHFSSKYEELDKFLSETKSVFEHTQLALEGVTFLVR